MEVLRNPFGTTGLDVTNICVGAAPIGGLPYRGYRLPERQAIETVLYVFNSSFRFLDTASLYADSEKRVGKVIKEYGGLPADFVIATKADRNPENGDFSPEQVQKSVEESLNRLGTNKLQIVYLHDPEYSSFSFEQVMAKNGPVEKLHQLKKQGLIGHIGISGGPIEMMNQYVDTGKFEIIITHNRFTLLNRLAEPLIENASKRGMAVVNAAIYNMGILAKGLDAFPYFYNEEANQSIIDKMKLLESLCEKFHVPLAAVALQFSLRDKRISSTVVGMSSPQEVDQNLLYVETKIPEALWKELDSVPTETIDPADFSKET